VSFLFCFDKKRDLNRAVLNEHPVDVQIRADRSPSRAEISNPSSAAKKSKPIGLDFFICADRHNIVCVAHATSFDRMSTSFRAKREHNYSFSAQMNEVEALPQMMLQQVANDVMLRINDVALRANGIVTICSVC